MTTRAPLASLFGTLAVWGCFTKPEPPGQHGGDAATADAATAACPPDRTGLVLHLAFDDAEGPTATDTSGNMIHGSVTGATWTMGWSGGALAFDGAGDRVFLGSAPALDDLPAITVCAWIAPTDSGNQFLTIADKSIDGLQGGWNAYLEKDVTLNEHRIAVFTSFREWVYGRTPIDVTGRWTHVCAVWDGTRGMPGMALYLGGAPEGIAQYGAITQVPDRDPDANQALVVGMVGDSGTSSFTGKIDELLVFGRALSAADVAAVHGCGSSRPPR